MDDLFDVEITIIPLSDGSDTDRRATRRSGVSSNAQSDKVH